MTVYHTHLQALDGSWRVRNGSAELEGRASTSSARRSR